MVPAAVTSVETEDDPLQAGHRGPSAKRGVQKAPPLALRGSLRANGRRGFAPCLHNGRRRAPSTGRFYGDT